jgi:hypothetical protein
METPQDDVTTVAFQFKEIGTMQFVIIGSTSWGEDAGIMPTT